MAVHRLEAEGLGRGRGIDDGNQLKLHFQRMQLVGQVADGVFRLGNGGGFLNLLTPRLGNTAGAAHILQKTVDIDTHLAASLFFSIASTTANAALLPFLIWGA